jgi:hypothetical protein
MELVYEAATAALKDAEMTIKDGLRGRNCSSQGRGNDHKRH